MIEAPACIDTDLSVALRDFAHAAAAADRLAQQGTLQAYQRGKAANTLRRQRCEIKLFEAFLADLKVPLTGLADDLSLWAGMRSGLVVAFRLWLEQHAYKFGPINLCLSTIRVYSQLAYKAGYLPIEAWQPIAIIHDVPLNEQRLLDEQREVGIGKKKAKATHISKAQLALLKRKLRESTDPLAARDLLMVCFLADHAMRVSELASLSMQDVDLLSTRFLIDRRKTHLRHYHGISVDTLEALSLHLERRCASDVTLLGIGTGAIRKRCAIVGRLIGLELSPHDFRHYYATYGDGDLIDIAKAGGWSNVNMIMRYRLEQANANANVTISSYRDAI